ncbi:MAG: hypothetical protein CL910_04295 [Deltaproteobacteria bacterium]|jgi:hypothetical protein|nr:hypothetical protein [Deltaproteobacteria bacterium]
MARFDRYIPGQFSWVDLMSPDPEASPRFYQAVFGWSPVASQDDAGGSYTMFKLQDLDVAGMGAMPDEMKSAGVPAHWNSYVTVEDVDAKAAMAQALGAELQMPVIDIAMGGELVGRMAVVVDPEGARLSLWQPGSHPGAGLANEPGSFGWNELCSRNVPAARDFYGKLFDWSFRPADPAQPDGYQEILVGDRMNGGILPWSPEMGEIPPSWSVYFSVADCDETVKRIQELGGQLLMGPTDISPGRFAVAADPQGAVFDVMFMHQPD